MNILTTYDVAGQWYGLGTYKHCNICFIDDNAKKEENNLEYDKIKRISNDVNHTCIL